MRRFLIISFVSIAVALGALSSSVAQGTLGPQGDITAVNAGTGLTGGAQVGPATVSADTTYLQRRVTGTCAVGNAIRVVAADGTVTCEPAGTITGTGTAGTVTRWTGASTLGNASTTDDGTALTVKDFRGTVIASTHAASIHDGAPTGIATATIWDINPTTNIDITGITGGVAGRILYLCNTSTASAFTLRHENAGSVTLANRLALPDATDGWQIQQNQCVGLRYRGDLSRWVTLDRQTQASKFSTGGAIFMPTGPTFTLATLFNDNVNLGNSSGDVATVTGTLDASAGVTKTGDTRGKVITPSVIGTIDNWAPTDIATATTIIATTTGNTTLNGMTGGALGRQITIHNDGAHAIAFAFLAGTSLAPNRFYFSSGTASKTLPANRVCAISFIHSGTYWYETNFACNKMDELLTVSTTGAINGGAQVYAYGGGSYLMNGSLNFLWATNATAAGKINALGYAEGVTQFRDLDIQDGKGASVAYFTGSTKSLAVNGTLSVPSGPTIVSELRGTVIAPGTITGTINDWAPTGIETATTINITSTSGAVLLTGLTGGVSGRYMTIVNNGTLDVLIRQENAGSLAANRFQTGYGDDLNLEPANLVTLQYISGRWHVRSKTGRMIPSVLVTGALTGTSNFSATGTTNTIGDATTDTLTVGATTTHTGPTTVQDFRGTTISPALHAGGTENNYAPTSLSTAKNIYVTSSADLTFNGLTGGVDGREITICNGSNIRLIFNNENAGGTAANRFRMPAGTSWILYGTAYWAANGMECITFVYNGTLSRWLMTDIASADMPKLEVGELYTTGTSTFTGTTTSLGNVTLGNAVDDIITVQGTVKIGSATLNTHVNAKALTTPPALTVCGTTPSVTGSDFRGTITTGGGATACTLTFVTAFAAEPTCVITSRDGTARAYTVSATAFTLSSAGNLAKYDYICIGAD